MFLLYICTAILVVSCDGISSEEPLINVNATVGSTALLPCNCTTEPGKTPHVEWIIDTETVFEREGGDSYHGEGYEGRVDVSEDELNKGNCSLVLKNVTVNDENVYKCSLMVNSEQRPIQKVRLSVVAKETTTPSSDSFRDHSNHSSENENEPPAGSRSHWIIIIILCVGLVAAAVMMIFIYRKKRGLETLQKPRMTPVKHEESSE
ncbi:CD276 antigen homolog [Trichomycterus rosablanca]|uniref:CD276 antigen homolog n=1 Tax=Trichomycterus rosablanca TaxID=2290929 RepID=UPI002F35E0DC